MSQYLPSYLTSSSLLSVVLLSPNGVFRYVNDVFRAQLADVNQALEGQNISDVFHSDDVPFLESTLRKCLVNPGVSHKIKLRGTASFPEQPDCCDWEFSYAEQDGILGFGFDPGPLNKALYDAELNLKALLNSTSDSNVFIDLNKRLIAFNTVAADYARIFQNAEYRVGASFEDYILPNYREAFHLNFDAAARGQTVAFELQVDFGHRIGWFFMKYVPVYDQYQRIIGVSYTVSDITDRKNFEQQILQQNARLRDIAWEQSHTVRKPLCNLMAIADMFSDKLDANTARNYATLLKAEARKLDDIIRTIVSLTDDMESTPKDGDTIESPIPPGEVS